MCCVGAKNKRVPRIIINNTLIGEIAYASENRENRTLYIISCSLVTKSKCLSLSTSSYCSYFPRQSQWHTLSLTLRFPIVLLSSCNWFTPQRFTIFAPPRKIKIPHMGLEGVLTRSQCAENGAQFFWTRVRRIWSHKIVKYLISWLSTFWVSHSITKWSLDLQIGPWVFLKR